METAMIGLPVFVQAVQIAIPAILAIGFLFVALMVVVYRR